MSAQKFDGAAYKSGQKEQWDSVADAWRKWWPTIEKGARSASIALADAIDAKPGQRILDVSTGIGEPAVTLAGLVGPEGSIVATDQSAGMLAVAGERIKEEGLSNIELVEVDTEVLDLPEDEFDGAVCRWGLMFLPDLQAGLQAIRRSLKPGAKFAAIVWPTPERVPFMSLPMAVAQQVLDPPPPPPPAGVPNPFSLGGDGMLQTAFKAAGFKNVVEDTLQIQFDLESPQEYCEFLGDVAPPVRAMLAGRASDQIEQFWSAVASKAGAFVDENGNFGIPNTAPLAIGTKK
ncbi:MAG: class I SAM-dependent methyltransferase [Chloroflexi bacterium]|nr:class I SAM-dependent methyltransferase [Chloroflexota bacterium]